MNQQSHAGDSEDLALRDEAARLNEQVKDLRRRRDRHTERKPIVEPRTRAERRELERWQRKDEELETELQRHRAELAQLQELHKGQRQRDPEFRATEVTFECGKCGQSITTTQGDVLDDARVVCPSCGVGIRLTGELK